VLAQQRDLDGATQYLQKALEIDPFHLESRYNLARILHEQGKHQRAIIEYERTIKEKPDFVEAHVSMGVALAESGRLAEAIREFRAALALRPDHAAAKKNLEMALQLQVRQR
jgi:tetratricopeptide (TPR) repeat protein